MKKLLFLAFFILTTLILKSKTKNKHEFGIGIGFNECKIHPKNTYFEDYTDPDKKVILYQIMGNSFQDGYSSYSYQYYQTSHTLPCIYYQYQLSKKLEFRLSFQMSSAKSISTIPTYNQFPSSKIENKMRKYDLNLGFFLNLLQSERAKLSLGLGLNSDPLVEKEKTTAAGEIIEETKYIESKLRSFSTLSLCIPFDEWVNIKYDITCLTDAVIVYLRPMNRISINFKF